MPYLTLTTNLTLDSTRQTETGKALSTLLAKETGKPERYVMVRVQAEQHLLFAGSEEPAAYLECKSIGLSRAQASSLAGSIPALLQQQLGLAADRIYIEFSNCPAEFWGWNGSTFG